ncbi:MAG: hypothetical protein K1X62_12805 [Cyclobacteriaceae bacterium]|nr:hypothetical protein [Cyclobacteriaceae bacterium]
MELQQHLANCRSVKCRSCRNRLYKL